MNLSDFAKRTLMNHCNGAAGLIVGVPEVGEILVIVPSFTLQL